MRRKTRFDRNKQFDILTKALIVFALALIAVGIFLNCLAAPRQNGNLCNTFFAAQDYRCVGYYKTQAGR